MLIHEDVTKIIIGSFYKVYNTLGYGFLEQVYENAMLHELSVNSLDTKSQFPISVIYESIVVGKYYADILVENKVIVELKALPTLNSAHESQLLNYLKATGLEVGILLNFGKVAKYKRMINTRKSV